MEASNEESLSLLRASLAEAQATVRSYDTKAQIVGIGYIFALGIVGNFEEWVPDVAEVNALANTLIAWSVIMLPIFLFGYVLYPSRKMAPKLAETPSKTLERVLYVDPSRLETVQQVTEAAGRAVPEKEVAFELLKVSKLREVKRKRFLRALFAAGFCFVVIFTSHLMRSL